MILAENLRFLAEACLKRIQGHHMAIQQVTCFKCSTKTDFDHKLGFRAECSQCGEDLHCCKNCRFFDPNAYNECKESSADVVREKERSNFCDYFEALTDRASEDAKKDDLKSAAEALFKKK